MPATKTVQWKACSMGHVYLGSRGCPACERSNALRPKAQQTRRQRSQALNTAEQDLRSEGSRMLSRPSERTAVARTLVTLRPPA